MMLPNPQFPTSFITLIEEIPDEKLHFVCKALCRPPRKIFTIEVLQK